MTREQDRDGPHDERKLLQLAAAGDERAFRSIVQLHSPAVAAIITSMLGAGDDVDDAGQETFIRLMRALPKFRGDASIRTYVTRIAMNVSLDVLARRKRSSRFVSLDASDDTATQNIPSSDVAADQSQEIRERTRIVQHAVNTLDAKHRAVVVLRLLEEKSTKESAQLLGIPEGTVMSRLTRAMRKLEQLLRPVLER